jgi:hypothetical protein
MYSISGGAPLFLQRYGGKVVIGSTTTNSVDKLQVDGSMIATAIKKEGGTSNEYLKADGSVSAGAASTGFLGMIQAFSQGLQNMF